MGNKNTGEAYEKLTQYVFHQIVNQNSVQNINVQHNVTLQGKTTTHQIDVYWEFKVAGIPYQTIIQTKDLKSKVKKVDMLAFKAILDDFPSGTKGIFVSRTGFQSGAIAVAQAHGIKIYELRAPTEEDWAGSIKIIEIKMHVASPYCKKINISLDSEWIVKNKIDVSRLPSGTPFHGNFEIVDQNNTSIGTMADLVNGMLAKAPEVEKHIETEFHDKFIVLGDGHSYKLKSVSGDFGCRIYEDTIRIDIENIVGMILKDILEGQIRRFDRYNNLLGANS